MARIADDTFRAALAALFPRLQRDVLALADVAAVSATCDDRGLYVVLRPRLPGACPLELLVHPTRRADVQIGRVCHRDAEMDPVDQIIPLVTAVATGLVVQRHTASAVTGAAYAVTTIVRLTDGGHWQRVARDPSAINRASDGEDGRVVIERSFLPYRR